MIRLSLLTLSNIFFSNVVSTKSYEPAPLCLSMSFFFGLGTSDVFQKLCFWHFLSRWCFLNHVILFGRKISRFTSIFDNGLRFLRFNVSQDKRPVITRVTLFVTNYSRNEVNISQYWVFYIMLFTLNRSSNCALT